MCTEKLAKVVLVVLNVAFFLGGGAILAVGIIAYVDEDLLYDITNLLTDQLSSIFEELEVLANIDLNGLIKNNAIIIIVVGGVLFSIGFVGCCGALRKSSCLLNLYAIILLIILGTEVGLGVYAYMFSDKLESKIQDGLHLSMAKYYTYGIRFQGKNLVLASETSKPVDLAWDTVQLEAACCGVRGQSDWLEAPLWNRTYVYNGNTLSNVAVPPACCLRTEQGQGKTDLSTLTGDDFTNIETCMRTGAAGVVNGVGCYDRVREIIFDNQNIIIGVFICLVIIEILGISCACFLKNKSKS